MGKTEKNWTFTMLKDGTLVSQMDDEEPETGASAWLSAVNYAWEWVMSACAGGIASAAVLKLARSAYVYNAQFERDILGKNMRKDANLFEIPKPGFFKQLGWWIGSAGVGCAVQYAVARCLAKGDPVAAKLIVEPTDNPDELRQGTFTYPTED